MPEEVLLLLSEGLCNPNYLVGDASGVEVGRVTHAIFSKDAQFSYLNGATYTACQRISLFGDCFDLIDDQKRQGGASDEESTLATSSRILGIGFQNRWEIVSKEGKLCLWEDGVVCLLGQYEANFRILRFDGSEEEGQCLGMINSIKPPSRDFNLTFDPSVLVPIRLFCFTLALHHLRTR